jgi:ABC-type lipoprotein export system ATPase subunit
VILQTTDLRKTYAGGAVAVAQAEFAMSDNEFVSIIGRSGSGKSTLLAMIGALTRPTEGQVLLAGQDIWALPEAALADLRCREFGLVFQFPSLLPNLQAVENVALPALLGGTMPAAEAYARARSLLERTGLREVMDSYPAEMSGGEQRRVAIARALINRPRLLLADEPTGDLDEDTEDDVITLLTRLREETPFGMIMVTHNVALARRADRVFAMDRGVFGRTDLPVSATPVPEPRPRRFAVPPPANDAEPVADNAGISRMGRNLWAVAGRTMAAGLAVFALVLAANYGLGRYQDWQVEQRRDQLAALEELATATLRGEIASVTRLGGNRFRIEIYLDNTAGASKPIYILSPSVKAFVQAGLDWQEVPLEAKSDATASVLKVVGKQVYTYILEARLEKFTQLLPFYMHVRFVNEMLVSPQSTPRDDLFRREDSYYIYLRPDGVDDATISRSVRFAGSPPTWIWMPPH